MKSDAIMDAQTAREFLKDHEHLIDCDNTGPR